MHDDTRIVIAGREPFDHGGAVNPPVYHASTILYPNLKAWREAANRRISGEQAMLYGRMGTPTTFALENAITELEGGHRTLVYPSGLAAITGALLALLKAGDHLLVTDNVYEPTRHACNGMLKRFGVETTYFDPAIGAGISELMRPNTAAVFLEAPGSMTFDMSDVPAISAAAHAGGAKVLMDNTWATPLFFKPIQHGVDVSIQAGTKYIVGHADAMLGLATATSEVWPALLDTYRRLGLCAGPDDVYLAQRGLRTLSVRLQRHQASGIKVAEWLRTRPEVRRVLHPALPDDPGHALWRRDFTGACGLFGVELQPCSETALAALIDDLELFGLGASWGGFESLILPQNPSHSRVSQRWKTDGQLVRLHIGLENVDDLIADLAAGLDRFSAAL